MPDRSIQTVLVDGFHEHAQIIDVTQSTMEADPLLAHLAEQIEGAAEGEVKEAILGVLNGTPEIRHAGEAFQYFAHRFRWEWLRTEFQRRFDDSTTADNWARMRYYRFMLEAFDDDWEDIDLHPSLEERRRGNA